MEAESDAESDNVPSSANSDKGEGLDLRWERKYLKSSLGEDCARWRRDISVCFL